MQWHPPYNLWILVTIGAVCLSLVPLVVLRSRHVNSRRARVFLLLLRLAVLGVLLILLAGPVSLLDTPFRPKPIRQILLVDNSESMGLNTPRSRAASARLIYQDAQEDAAARERLDLVYFDEKLHEEAETPEAPGKATFLGTALTDLLRRTRDTGVTDVVLFSDGRIHDRPRLSRAVMQARRAGIQVSACPVGTDAQLANLAIENCVVARVCPPRTRLPLRVHFRSEGLAGKRCVLTVTDPDGEQVQSVPFAVEDGLRVLETFIDVVETGGEYTVALSEQTDEISFRDNVYRFGVEVKERRLRVLYMEGTPFKQEEWDWDEYRFLKEALEETGTIDVDVLTVDEQKSVGGRLRRVDDPSIGYPDTRKQLFKYDLVICSDINRHIFTPDQMRWTVELVAERGGGFCMVGGYTSFNAGGYDRTVWEQMIPVDMTGMDEGYDNTGFYPDVPLEARGHAIMQFDPDPDVNNAIIDCMPPFLGTNLVRRPKPAATLLVRHPGRDIPTICVQPYGRGRTMAFMSDTTSGWGKVFETAWGKNALTAGDREMLYGYELNDSVPAGRPLDQGGDNSYFKRFWVNSVRWLTRNSLAHRETTILPNTERITYRPGEGVRVRVGVLDDGDTIDPPSLQVSARLDLPEQRWKPLPLIPETGEYGGELHLPAWVETASVPVLFRAEMPDGTVTEDAVEVRVLQIGREFRDPRPNHELLEDLARATGGEVVRSSSQLKELLERDRDTIEDPVSFRVPNWDRAWLWGLIVLLLTVDWGTRRLF